MSQRNARLLAAGLWTFGVGALVMVAINLDPAGLILLGMGLASLLTGNWINRVTAADTTPQASISAEPKPPDSSVSPP